MVLNTSFKTPGIISTRSIVFIISQDYNILVYSSLPEEALKQWRLQIEEHSPASDHNEQCHGNVKSAEQPKSGN